MLVALLVVLCWLALFCLTMAAIGSAEDIHHSESRSEALNARQRGRRKWLYAALFFAACAAVIAYTIWR